ncbi:MAG: DUF4974 domain-containing protein [Bacteroidaceae bacterium]|nr:DUF4974 domain-containing protein [Bacteroidaceae bacterium]
MTDNDIQNWMNEPDGKELYRMACEVKRAHAVPSAQPDVDAEWQSFRTRHMSKKPATWHKFIAVAASLLLICGIGIAAILPVFRQETAQSQDTPVTPKEAQAQPKGTVTVSAESFVFHQVTLENILNQLAAHYHAQVQFANPELKSITLYVQIDKNQTLQQAVQFLNHFDKVNIRLQGDTMVVE